jgi:hypothetical protein
VLAILGKISLSCFPELSWAGVLVLSVADSSRYHSPIPASQESDFLLPDVRPLLPPSHFTSQRKKNLFQRTCGEWPLTSSVNSFAFLDGTVHLVPIILSGRTWDAQKCKGVSLRTFRFPLMWWVLSVGRPWLSWLGAFTLGLGTGRWLRIMRCRGG